MILVYTKYHVFIKTLHVKIWRKLVNNYRNAIPKKIAESIQKYMIAEDLY